ncbi:MAG: ATP-binding protein [Methanobacterium formicicum]
MNNKRVYKPGDGERRAIGGYLPQYVVSSSIILNKLRNKDLQWIKVADPEAGRVDDLQISNQSRLDAFQVKWSRLGGTFTFNNLIVPSENKPSLINQLAEGWKRLRENNLEKRVVVHLVTNQIPSVSDRLPKDESPRHFKSFIEQVWNEVKQATQNYNVSTEWESAWNTFKEASKLDEEDFNLFIKDCELNFNYQLPDMDNSTPDHEIMKKDLEDLTYFLMQTVADPGYIIKLKHDQLLEKLGWKARFEFRSLHEFPVDEKLYYPIEGTIQRLDELISSLSGGYIVVLGSPGSGKSTLLTQVFRSRSERVIRYYAYVPEALDPVQFRGESVNFLHDMVIALENAGFVVGRSPSKFDRAQLLERFYQQLDLLHQDWVETGRKTIIVIDGLDHIVREQNPEYSLLNDLPLTDQVSEGVFFVLGSQTESPLPNQIQSSINRENRIVTMEALPRAAVFSIINKADLFIKLSGDQINEIYRLSDGHPLALSYILRHIETVKDPDGIDSILQSTMKYEGNIEDQYYSYWKEIEDDYELINLIGLIARLRSSIDLSWIETWSDPSIIHLLRQKFRQYFRIEENRLHFFHNSFRLFLLSKTAESFSGNYNPNKDRQIHYELSKICNNSDELKWKWEELYHLYLAGKHELVLEKASQDFFREQFLSLRSPIGIQSDIKLSLKSVALCNDPIALTRLLLAGAEITQRESNFDKLTFISLLIDLKEKDVIKYIYNNNELLIDRKDAFEMSVKLKENRMSDESKKLFELAEPIHDLMSSEPIEDDFNGDKRNILVEWAYTAPYYLNIEKIIEIITNIKLSTRGESDDISSTNSLKNEMLFQTGLSLLDQQIWDQILELNEYFDINSDTRKYWFWLVTRVWKTLLKLNKKPEAKIFFEKTLEESESLELDTSMRLIIAEGIFQLYEDKNKAFSYIEDIPQPELKTDFNTMNAFSHRFRLNRLLYVLGDEKSSSEIILDPDEPRQAGIVNFERCIVDLAKIWAYAWNETQLDNSSVIEIVTPLLRLHNLRNTEMREGWTNGYYIRNVRGEFYNWVIDAVSNHGSEAINTLKDLFENEWTDSEKIIYWPPEICLEVIMGLINAGISEQWSINQLKWIETRIMEINDISERSELCLNLAKAWLLLDKNDYSLEMLKKVLNLSFGVNYSDNQLEIWIKWLNIVNNLEPEKASERIQWFLKAILALEDKIDSSAANNAANSLLSTVFKNSPINSIKLFELFTEKRIIWFNDAIYTFLIDAIRSNEFPLDLILDLFSGFYIPFSGDPKLNILNSIFDKTKDKYGNEKVIEIANFIISSLDVYSPHSKRTEWANTIFGLLQRKNVDLDKINFNDTKINIDDPSRLIKLNDGSLLNFTELKGISSSISDIQAVINNESQESSFDWEEFVEEIIEELDHEDLIILINDLKSKDKYGSIRLMISKRLFEEGDLESAWAICTEILELSRPYEWTTQMGRGNRLKSFKSLMEIDREKTQPLMYKTLIEDIVTEFWYPMSILHNLDDFMYSLTEKLPANEIWIEIEEYLDSLFNDLNLSMDLSVDFSEEFEDDTTSRAITNLISSYITHPVNIISQISQSIIVKLLLKQDNEIQNSICEFLDKSESYQEQILMVLESVSMKYPDIVRNFHEKIVSFHDSPNYLIRRASWNICQNIGCPPIEIQDEMIELSETYYNDFGNRNILEIPEREIVPGEPLADSNDPIELVSPLNMHIDALATISRFRGINLCHRVVEIMNELAPYDSWSADGERKVRGILDSSGLRFSFNRPRSVIARRALLHAVCELIDANILGLHDFLHLDMFFQFYDSFMILNEPSKRPKYIKPAFDEYKDQFMPERTKKWIEEVDKSVKTMNFKINEETYILAQNTELIYLDTKRIFEQRKCKIDSRGYYNNSFFYRAVNESMSGYEDINAAAIPIPFIICNRGVGYESHGNHWLALNPLIAYQLDWELAEDGLFKWVNEKGEMMVESIWWKEGLVEQFKPLFDEVGEGWLVIASKEGLGALKDQYGLLKRYINIKRFSDDVPYKELNETHSVYNTYLLL